MSVEPLPREAEGTERGPSVGDRGYQMAILTANHGHVHTAMFRKSVPYRCQKDKVREKESGKEERRLFQYKGRGVVGLKQVGWK